MKPSGQQIGLRNKNYEFITSARDADGDKIYYKWDWGDGTFSEWLGPYESEEQVSIKHKWSSFGFFNVKVKVRDEHLAQSMWSQPVSVFMPRDNQISNPFDFRLFNHFTNIFQIIKIMKLLL
jgi:hypothetical protein